MARRPNCPSAAASSSWSSIARGSRAGRESRDGAVDRGAAGFATLQADVVAAMAKAGQRGSCGMGQPPGGGDQLIQLRALIALEQFDHPRDLRALAGRPNVGAAVALRAAAIFAAVFAFDESSFVFCGTAVLGMDCEPRSSAAMAFSPASVNFNAYAWPVSSSRRHASIPVFALISRARPAFRSLVATFCAAAAFRVFGGMRQRWVSAGHTQPADVHIHALFRRKRQSFCAHWRSHLEER